MFHLKRERIYLARHDIRYNLHDLLVQLLSLTSLKRTPSCRAKEKETSQRKASLSSSMSTEVDAASQLRLRGGPEVVFSPFVVSLEEVPASMPSPVIWSGQFIKQSQDTFHAILTRCIDIHPPQGPTHQVVVSTALPVTLALTHDGVRWRRIVPTEAFPSILDPSKGVTLVLLAASFNAPGCKHYEGVGVHKAVYYF